MVFSGLDLNINPDICDPALTSVAGIADESGPTCFAQLTQHLPLTTFRRCIAKYDGEHKVKSFSCLDQYLCMAFAQLTFRESLRNIEACLRAQIAKLYHMGIRGRASRSTLEGYGRSDKKRDITCGGHLQQGVRHTGLLNRNPARVAGFSVSKG